MIWNVHLQNSPKHSQQMPFKIIYMKQVINVIETLDLFGQTVMKGRVKSVVHLDITTMY